MDLLIVQLKAAIRRMLDAKGVRARVLDKVNRYGEVVIGVILEKPVANRLAREETTPLADEADEKAKPDSA